MSVNLAKIPDQWGDWLRMGYFTKPNCFLDANILHNGNPSIRIEARIEGDERTHWREINAEQIPVKVGDHIIFGCWVKTNPSTIGKNNQYGNGGLIAIDFYGSNRIHEYSSNDPRMLLDPNFITYRDDPKVYVPMNSDWQLRILDVRVPDVGQILDETTMQPSTEPITSIIPILHAGTFIYVGWDEERQEGIYAQEQGTIWFSEAELYINPEEAPAPIYPCPFCDMVFSSEEELGIHISDFHQQPPITEYVYICQTCQANFKTVEELSAHILAEHQGPTTTRYCLILATMAFLPLANAIKQRLLTQMRQIRDNDFPKGLTRAYYGFSRLVLR